MDRYDQTVNVGSDIFVIEGTVTLIEVPVKPDYNYVLAGQPSLQFDVKAVYQNGGERAKCVISSAFDDLEYKNVSTKTFRRLVVVCKDFSYVPTSRQIIFFALHKKIGKNVEFSVLNILPRYLWGHGIYP